MLQQILRDMYVDPEILAELPEEQKEMLFYKIRQEQIRRYNEREKQNNSRSFGSKKTTKKAKKVRILEDAEGNPWTWICGEFKGDVSAEEKWKQLHKKKSQAEIYTTRGKSVQAKTPAIERALFKDTLTMKQKTNRRSPSSSPPNSRTNMASSCNNRTISPKSSPVIMRREQNCTYNENSIRGQLSRFTPLNSGLQHKQETDNVFTVKARQVPDPRQSQRSINYQKVDCTNEKKLKQDEGVIKKPLLPKNEAVLKNKENIAEIQKAADPEKRNKGNVYESFNTETKSSDDEIVSNEEWTRQLRRFKEADRNRSIRAKRASKEYRRQSLVAADSEKLRVRFKDLAADNCFASTEEKPRPVIPPKPNALRVKHPMARSGRQSKPQNREEVKQWFEETQSSVLKPNQNFFPGWFHGIITRAETEELLKNKNTGDYLIRVSDKVWGYVLSYKDCDKIKHFLIDASESQCYHFFGNDQIRHESLDDLIAYHQDEAISYNNEKLKNYVGQKYQARPDYEELERNETDTRL